MMMTEEIDSQVASIDEKIAELQKEEAALKAQDEPEQVVDTVPEQVVVALTPIHRPEKTVKAGPVPAIPYHPKAQTIPATLPLQPLER